MSATLSKKLDALFRNHGINPLEAKVYGGTLMTYWAEELDATPVIILFRAAGLVDVKAFESRGRWVVSGNVA